MQRNILLASITVILVRIYKLVYENSRADVHEYFSLSVLSDYKTVWLVSRRTQQPKIVEKLTERNLFEQILSLRRVHSVTRRAAKN
jgi:hypothetical protein